MIVDRGQQGVSQKSKMVHKITLQRQRHQRGEIFDANRFSGLQDFQN